MKKTNMFLKGLSLLLVILLVATVAIVPVLADSTASDGEGTTSKTFGEWISNNRNAFVWIIFAIILVIVCVVIFVKFPGKAKNLFETLKAECKRITWFSKEQTKKASIITIIILAAFALVICLLDLGLSRGILALIDLIAG